MHKRRLRQELNIDIYRVSYSIETVNIDTYAAPGVLTIDYDTALSILYAGLDSHHGQSFENFVSSCRLGTVYGLHSLGQYTLGEAVSMVRARVRDYRLHPSKYLRR